jgi:DNA topoisomerase II
MIRERYMCDTLFFFEYLLNVKLTPPTVTLFFLQKTLLQNIKLDLKKLENKVRFIRCVVDNEIVVNNRKRADLFLELREKNFDPFPMKKKKAEPAAVGAIEEEENEESPEAANGVDPSDYEYLISMAIGTLTLEKIQDLNAEREKLVNEVEELENTTPKSLWLRDLDTFEKDLDVSNAILICSVYSFLLC